MTRVLYGQLNSRPRGAESPPSLTIFTKLVGCWDDVVDQPIDCGTIHAMRRETVERLCLYKLNMPADGSLEASVEVRMESNATGIQHGVYVAYQDSGGGSTEYAYHSLPPFTSGSTLYIVFPILHSKQRLIELGVFMSSDMDTSSPIALLDIGSIVIKPRKVMELQKIEAAFSIDNVRLVKEVQGSQAQKRIAWRWAAKPRQDGQVWAEGMPWSKTTGPFSSFAVYTGRGKDAITTYCNECLLTAEEVEALDGSVVVKVVGTFFGGGQVSSDSVRLMR